jgi:hypothetical protein
MRNFLHTGVGADVGGAVARCRSFAVSSLIIASFTGCSLDRALKVTDVDVATPESVNSAAGLDVLYAGGRADFQNAVTGTDAAVTMPGLLTDELRDIDTFPTRIEVDQRQTQVRNGTVQTWYRNMHQARASLERATEGFHKYSPTDSRLAELHALQALTYVLFGEDFCNGVAFSTFTNGTPNYGKPNTAAETFQLAVAQADSALSSAKAGSAEQNLAKVVRGRALLDLGRDADAATAVQGVPVEFQYFVYNSENSSRENNGVYVNVGPVSKRFGVADVDGVNGLAFRTRGMDTTKNTGDPRVRWYKSGTGQDGQSIAYYQVKYPSRSAGVVVADGIEAALIAAEHEQKSNDPAWLDTLNTLRANTTLLNRPPYTYPGMAAPSALPALNDPGTTSGQVDLLFSERAFWMYLTGHRLGDLRRLINQYGRGAETVFPSGTYQGAAGGSMGSDLNFPIPIDEQNNPSAPACTDRDA